MKNKLLCCILTFTLCTPLMAFDHTYAKYQSVLDKYVQNGQVDYAALKSDRAALDSFVTSCGGVPFEHYQAFTKSEKLSFMINLYNAATMQLLIDHWPVASIQDIGGVFSSPWNKKFISAGRGIRPSG